MARSRTFACAVNAAGGANVRVSEYSASSAVFVSVAISRLPGERDGSADRSPVAFETGPRSASTALVCRTRFAHHAGLFLPDLAPDLGASGLTQEQGAEDDRHQSDDDHVSQAGVDVAVGIVVRIEQGLQVEVRLDRES